MSILYPVADTADGALHSALGFAARGREAETLARGPVAFATEATGPGFETREAALEAFAGRLDDDRPGHLTSIGPQARWCDLRSVAAPAKGRRRVRAPARPVNRDGRRWPAPAEAPTPTVWRLFVSYWRVVGETADAPLDAARKVRRDPGGEDLAMDALKALAGQPLRPMKPQQPLDVGLFETRPPEAPHIIMPDE
jgi:hypothetical protein